MAKRPGIFPTFFISGFECSTFLWKDGRRRDLIEETRHRQHARDDYRMLHDIGIAVAREGIPWPMVDRGGRYDFSAIDPMIEAMNAEKILPIWDLCQSVRRRFRRALRGLLPRRSRVCGAAYPRPAFFHADQ